MTIQTKERQTDDYAVTGRLYDETQTKRENQRGDTYREWSGKQTLRERDHKSWCRENLQKCKFCHKDRPDHIGQDCPTHAIGIAAKRKRKEDKKAKLSDPGRREPHMDPTQNARHRRHAKRAEARDGPIDLFAELTDPKRKATSWEVGPRNATPHGLLKDTYHTNPKFKHVPNSYNTKDDAPTPAPANKPASRPRAAAQKQTIKSKNEHATPKKETPQTPAKDCARQARTETLPNPAAKNGRAKSKNARKEAQSAKYEKRKPDQRRGLPPNL